MKITKEWLKEKRACREGCEWFINQEETDAGRVMLRLVDVGRLNDALWVLRQTMNKKQSVQLAVFSARLCLKAFEDQFPDDDRPRKAIDAAEAYLKNPCERTISAAESAASTAWSAASAAWSAATLAATSASWSAEAAEAAASTARSAAWSAESAWLAAESAASAAESAAWWAARSAESKDTQTKIIKEAIKIMEW